MRQKKTAEQRAIDAAKKEAGLRRERRYEADLKIAKELDERNRREFVGFDISNAKKNRYLPQRDDE